MAKKTAIYFTHDSNARRDPKIRALIVNWGFAGYGMFWALIEMIREEGGLLELNQNTMIAIADELKIDANACEKFTHALLDLELIKKDEQNCIYSNRLNESISHLDKLKELRKKAAEKRWGNAKTENNDANAMQMHN
jgi:hypothetical protein